ncbi:MAG: hypothetical protein M1321_00960 [Candidatus Marsarchaeota archaeon]|jgi:hypothetical protein|nr:hypothetical protein [Candidatus Marsarchaeota archaeon]
MTLINDFFTIVVCASEVITSATILILTLYLLLARTQQLRRPIISRLMGFMAVLVASFVIMKLL